MSDTTVHYAQVLESSGEVLLRLNDGTETTLSAIVIAEQTRLLERLKAHYYITDEPNPEDCEAVIPLSAIDNELQQLRAGHGPDGGE